MANLGQIQGQSVAPKQNIFNSLNSCILSGCERIKIATSIINSLMDKFSGPVPSEKREEFPSEKTSTIDHINYLEDTISLLEAAVRRFEK